MLIPKIINLGYGKFSISWNTQKESNLNLQLDFNPLIEKYNLKGRSHLLIHWQAKPKGIRRWGIFDILNNKYYAALGTDIILEIGIKCSFLEVSESLISSSPSACLLFENCYIKKHKKIKICPLKD